MHTGPGLACMGNMSGEAIKMKRRNTSWWTAEQIRGAQREASL